MKLTPEQLKQNAAAMIAFADGKKVQRTAQDDFTGLSGWFDTNPIWEFDRHLYRPKPEPKTRPWSKPEDVPGPVCWLRFANESWGDTMIIGVRPRGIYVANIDIKPGVYFMDWKYFVTDYTNYSTDRKTWLPCEVTEG